MPKCPILSEEPSYNQILLFLKNSKPHMDVLHALPLYLYTNNQSYLTDNSTIHYKQFVFVDLERWDLIELIQEFDVVYNGYSSITHIKCKWQITLTGEQYLADIDYVGN